MPVNTKVFPLAFTDNTAGSTDVGDVSWVVPTAQVTIGCEPQGTPPHSWQWVANGKSSVSGLYTIYNKKTPFHNEWK
jgi:aminobenzoyl-glutamate utilization protein B